MHRDFFISRAGADKKVAQRIDDIVKKAGKTTWLQDTDFGHASFMERMAEGFSGCVGMIALLSSSYQQSDYCKKEYGFSLTGDPLNRNEKLIVFRIDDCQPIEHLKDLAYTDLVPVLNDVQAMARIVRVAIGVDTSESDINFAKTHRRSAGKIVHPSIKKGHGLVEREDILQSIDTMLRGRDTNKAALTDVADMAGGASVVRGVGGVGKTILAKQYAWQYRNDFAGVWWIRADTRQNIRDDILALGSKLIPDIADIQDEETAVNTVLDTIATRCSQEPDGSLPWLLVYDNAESPIEIAELTPCEGASVLITSRRSDWQSYASEIAIDVFTPEVAVQFLLEHSREQNAESAARLAEALGHLPLALAHARAYCSSSGCLFDDYRARLPALIKKAPKNARYPKSVFATFDLALEQATANTPEAEALINILAFLAAERVPRSLLAEELGEQCDDGISALVNASLITLEQVDGGEITINCHRLVQEVARSRVSGNREVVIAQGLEMLIKNWPDGNQGSDPQFWPICRALLTHAQTLLAQANHEQGYAEKMALLMAFVAHYLGAQGKYQVAEPLYRQCLEIRQRVLGEEHPSTATSYNNVASNLNAQGKHQQAEPLYRQGLEICQRVLGEEHRSTATSYNNVASNLNAQGKHQQAEPLYRQGLEIRQRVLGEDHPSTAASYNNVAFNLDAQGKHQQAEPLYRQGLEIRQRVLGEDHPDTAASYNNVASNLNAQGKYQQAEPLFRRAYEILSSTLGGQHPTTKIVHQNWLDANSRKKS